MSDLQLALAQVMKERDDLHRNHKELDEIAHSLRAEVTAMENKIQKLENENQTVRNVGVLYLRKIDGFKRKRMSYNPTVERVSIHSYCTTGWRRWGEQDGTPPHFFWILSLG